VGVKGLNCDHQLSDFKAKMHHIRFWLDLCPRPSAPSNPLAGFKGPASMGRAVQGRGRWGVKEKTVRREEGSAGKRRGSPTCQHLWSLPTTLALPAGDVGNLPASLPVTYYYPLPVRVIYR